MSDEFIEVVGGEAALREISAGRGIIFTTFHYGNFEWTAQMIGLHNFPALTLAQEFKNPLLEPIVAKLRKTFRQQTRAARARDCSYVQGAKTWPARRCFN